MPVPRRLLTLLVLTAALTVVTSSGAFSAIAVDRGAAVVTASDLDGAYLRLAPHDGPNGAFAQDTDGDGTLELEFDGDAAGVIGSGPNPDAVTHIDLVFNVTNQGTQPVGVWITDGSAAVSFHTHDGGHGSIEGRANAVTLSTGETVQVSVEIDTTDIAAGVSLLETVTVHADAEAAS